MNVRCLRRKTVACFSRPTTASMTFVAVGVALLLLAITRDNGRVAMAAVVGAPPISEAKSSQPISLRDRLLTGLKARLKSEIAFVDSVVLAVNLGKLPQRLVDQTFFWARARASALRAGRQRRPIIYFRAAMISRAKRLRVDL